MKRGPWHQCGHQSQNVVADQLAQGNGAGVILSIVNVTKKRLVEIAADYRAAGADILLDLQLYNPGFSSEALKPYGLAEARQTTGALRNLTSAQLTSISRQIRSHNEEVGATAVLAPAIVYLPERMDIVSINEQLFEASASAAKSLGVPVYATLVLGNAFKSSPELADATLSRATNLPADGWYFSIENDREPVPADEDLVSLLLNSVLTLSCTNTPVMNAFAGPASLLSISVGATAVGIGHWKNLWQFDPGRFNVAEKSGGSTPAPRYFSSHLWSTLVLPDETANIGEALWSRIQSPSPFAPRSSSDGSWSLRASHNHLLHVLGTQISERMEASTVSDIARQTIADLLQASRTHSAIEQRLGVLRDGLNLHQHVWAGAITRILAQREGDFAYLDLI